MHKLPHIPTSALSKVYHKYSQHHVDYLILKKKNQPLPPFPPLIIKFILYFPQKRL